MLVQLINYVIMFSVTFMKKCMQMGTFGPGPNVAATFGPVAAIFGPTGQNMDAIFGPTGQNMDAIFGPGADIIWHGGTEYGSHILSGRPSTAAKFGPGPNLAALINPLDNF